jgi:hypothetical protein
VYGQRIDKVGRRGQATPYTLYIYTYMITSWAPVRLGSAAGRGLMKGSLSTGAVTVSGAGAGRAEAVRAGADVRDGVQRLF